MSFIRGLHVSSAGQQPSVGAMELPFKDNPYMYEVGEARCASLAFPITFLCSKSVLGLWLHQCCHGAAASASSPRAALRARWEAARHPQSCTPITMALSDAWGWVTRQGEQGLPCAAE